MVMAGTSLATTALDSFTSFRLRRLYDAVGQGSEAPRVEGWRQAAGAIVSPSADLLYQGI